MDFEDLLINTFLLFGDLNNIKILNRYQNLFKYILVDEYQDTNSVQYEIVKALSWQHKNLFVVGDDYQNIYSFRGASKLNIDRFQNDFNNYKLTKLCENYRSNKIIVNTASKLIQYNKHQIIKELFSNINETEGKIKLISCFNGIDEATKVAYIIQKLIIENKCNYNDIAVLYRMNLQHSPFKKVFFIMGIPHKISNANTIFDSKYIKIIYIKRIVLLFAIYR
jgi:DNA helicase-2/ATP-dependent DNA helicase PcrA